MRRDYDTYLRQFHEAKWDEELIFELSVPGERGILVPQPDEEIVNEVGNGIDRIPETMRRKKLPELPELSQPRINRHYLRLTQEIMGMDVAPDICEGTCTMKYSPKVQEHMVAHNPGLVDIHPYQDPDTLQGLLEIYKKTENMVCEISGMDAFNFHAGGGAAACYLGACIVREYFHSKGDDKRDEIITTIFSHPCDAGAPATAGFKVITLMPGEDGLPELGALKEALSERTAAIFVTNPEDTGIFNPHIQEYVEAAHEVGALCYYDQANVNGIMGITRARETGFDLIHYNLHKTFSSPHGGMGPGCGALGVREFLKPYLPVPRVEHDGERYTLDSDCPQSCGKIREFLGNTHVVARAYMWIMQLGAEGIKEAAVCSVLNNQYLMKKLSEIKGIEIMFAEGKRRLEQCRYSWGPLFEDTGFTSLDVSKRLIDFGYEHIWLSHHPFLVPEPMTLEPTESNSKDDLDELVCAIREVARECYEEPELIKGAPFHAPIHDVYCDENNTLDKIAVTYRQLQKRRAAGTIHV
ncbi:aminomethyl-transferring glycine dehydrogenase subunit GcvPB [Hespellia stercorisuis]|uniref:glycine dehydrogenase (aminomethyl-transferring) n=1 Tax=Hespellia stercorisuis DSM 15480 TaxID=1121950 RepID=A0A1M6IZ71_9FIRM|nr:aminomethyl-transferring glycine dehydrogenase subunit GcvPB [Hespellia stercorisuis]SHJ39759.1 glycine dehydrogenase subunit 2 [Hespellia stercorisuis DSM 15480]